MKTIPDNATINMPGAIASPNCREDDLQQNKLCDVHCLDPKLTVTVLFAGAPPPMASTLSGSASGISISKRRSRHCHLRVTLAGIIDRRRQQRYSEWRYGQDTPPHSAPSYRDPDGEEFGSLRAQPRDPPGVPR
jgi:hypothetical protein